MEKLAIVPQSLKFSLGLSSLSSFSYLLENIARFSVYPEERTDHRLVWYFLFPLTCLPRFENLPRPLWHSVAVFYSSPSDKTVLQRLYGQLLSLTLGPRCWFNEAKNFTKLHQIFSYFYILGEICFQTNQK